MKLFAALLASSAALVAASDLSAGRKTNLIHASPLDRREDVCKPVTGTLTCEKSCGPGQITCVELPNCFKPSAGETCCSDGTYCPAGFYCTDAGCCPDSMTLAECDARAKTEVPGGGVEKPVEKPSEKAPATSATFNPPASSSSSASSPSSARGSDSSETTPAPKPSSSNEDIDALKSKISSLPPLTVSVPGTGSVVTIGSEGAAPRATGFAVPAAVAGVMGLAAYFA